MSRDELIAELNKRKSDNIKLAAPIDSDTAKMLAIFCKPARKP